MFLAERRPVIQGNLTSATDHRAGQLLVQRLPVLFILSILFIDVLFSFSSCAFVVLRAPSWISFLPLWIEGHSFLTIGRKCGLVVENGRPPAYNYG